MTTNNERRESDVRIAVAESRLDSHAQLIETNQELTARLVDRLDSHIQDGVKRDENIRSELSNVTVAISKNNAAVANLTTVVSDATTAIREISSITRNNQLELVKIDTVWHTVAKIAAIVVMVLGAMWGVVTYALDKTDVAIVSVDKK